MTSYQLETRFSLLNGLLLSIYYVPHTGIISCTLH